MVLRPIILGLVLLGMLQWNQTATAQRAINPVVRTFRPDPNWGGYDVKRPAGALVFLDSSVADPAAFIRGNRCLVGRWVFDRQLEEAYFGYLQYANANDDALGVRQQAGPFRVVLPTGTDVSLALWPPQRADVVILREIPGTSYHELVACNGIPQEDQVYLPRSIANTGDAYWGSREFMYQR